MKINWSNGLHLVWLILIAIIWFRVTDVPETVETPKPKVKAEVEEEEDFELANEMGRLQLFMSKLWFSAKAENADLAAFYVHEIEESMEKVVESGVVDDDVPVATLMKSMGMVGLNGFEKEVDANGFSNFENAYQNLLTHCNNCHVATNHGFIVITPPAENPYNQDFSKKE